MLTIDGSMGEGGERWQATFHPAASFERLELLERGGVQRRSATAISRKCQGRWLCASSTRLHALSTGKGPGVAPRWSRTHTGQAMLSSRFVESEHVTEVFTEFGERGVRAEAIAEAVAKEVTRYLAAGVPVGEHLADQLLVPMVLGQGASSARSHRPPTARRRLLWLRCSSGCTSDRQRKRAVCGGSKCLRLKEALDCRFRLDQ